MKGLYSECPVCGSEDVTQVAFDGDCGYNGYVCHNCNAEFQG